MSIDPEDVAALAIKLSGRHLGLGVPAHEIEAARLAGPDVKDWGKLAELLGRQPNEMERSLFVDAWQRNLDGDGDRNQLRAWRERIAAYATRRVS